MIFAGMINYAYLICSFFINPQSDCIFNSLRMTIATQTFKISSKGGDLKFPMSDNSDHLFMLKGFDQMPVD